MKILQRCLAGSNLKTCIIVFAVLLFSELGVLADRVILKIQVGNPAPRSQSKEIKVNLPAGIGTNEIISLDGLDLGYDIKNDLYYVYKKIDLEPQQILQPFNVEFKDIWVVPEETLNGLQKHIDGMIEKLKGKEQEKTAQELKSEITKLLANIKILQEQNSIKSGVKTIQHIRAYESNLAEMETARKFIGRMENLVLATGQDPGRLEGDPKGAPTPKRDIEMKPQDYKTVIVRITMKNVSAVERKDPLSRDLPSEIKANDVLDSAGLDVRTDMKPGICCIYSPSVVLAPNETKVFDVKIRDKWNVNFPRFQYLRATASNVLERATAKSKFKSIEDMLKGLITELDVLEKDVAPVELNDKYVAFFRHQASKLDVIEQKINRVETALKPFEPKVGFNAPPPNPKTTWMIIWIILGFLAFLSLVFFFRWYGKTKAEKITDENT